LSSSWPRYGKCLLKPGSALLMLTWPLLIWLGIRYSLLYWLLPLMVLLQLLHLRGQGKTGPMGTLPRWVAGLGILLCLASALMRQQQWLLYYPVMVNGLMLLLFSGSLWSPMPLVERLARLREPDLPPVAIRYTRRVTQVWCGFFVLNGAIALYTCQADDIALWASWNGLIAYLLMGSLMAGEWLVRRWIMRCVP